MTGTGAAAVTKVTPPSAEELISIGSINDLDVTWINSELCFLDEVVTESTLDPTCKSSTKPQLVQKLNTIAARANDIKNLIRVLHRLAKTNATTQQICEEVVSAVSAKLESSVPDRTYAQALRIPGQTRHVKTDIPTQVKETGELSANAPTFTPSPRHELTIVPKNYDKDVENLHKTLNKAQVSNSRKSKKGNIVLSFPSNNSMKSAQDLLSKKPEVKLHTHEKSLPKMTIRNVGVPDEEVVDSIISKNPRVQYLVEKGYHFELLFVQKLNIPNRNNGTFEARNAVIKMDPIIRECIKESKYKIFVGLRICNVFDRIHFKTCYNCQKIGSHTSTSCPTSNTPTCRYCSLSHRSVQCEHKNDSNKHQCSNCLNSDNDNFKAEAKTHIANSKSCPYVVEMHHIVMSNTQYEVANPKNA